MSAGVPWRTLRTGTEITGIWRVVNVGFLDGTPGLRACFEFTPHEAGGHIAKVVSGFLDIYDREGKRLAAIPMDGSLLPGEIGDSR